MLFVVLMASPGAGAEPEGVRIDYGAPSSGCPDAAGFLRALRERTTDFRQAMPDEQARTFTIHVAPMGSAYSGQLEVRGLTGSVAVRHVEAKSCDQVVNALALITALAISPSALMDGPKSADNAADKMAESTADRDRSPTVQKIAPSAMQDEAQPWQWSAGMLGLMVTRVSPNLSYGGELFAEVEAPASSRWGPSFRLGAFFTQSRTEFAAPADASARFQWFGAALEGCPVRLVGWGRRLAVAPCVTLHLGGLRAQGRGISQPKKAASFWADAGPLLRLRLALTARISLEAHGALILPLTQPTFEIMDMVSRKPAAEYSVARWGISVAVGAAYGFQ